MSSPVGGRRGERLRAALHRGGPGSSERWRSTDALRRGLLAGVVLVVAGVLGHRPEAVLLGAPLLLSAVVALLAPPLRAPRVAVRPGARAWDEAGGPPLVIEIDGARGLDLVAVRLPEPDRPGPGRVYVLGPAVRAVACRTRPAGWGEQPAVRPDHLAAGPDGTAVLGPVVATETRRVVLPALHRVPAGPLPPRSAGLVGGHRSRRPGDSTDLRDIRPFVPGDRVRRVDWRVSLRTGDLHVRTTSADADADVVLALDTRADVSSEVAGWSASAARPGDRNVARGGSLDTAAVAVTALAAAHLRHGDRVGLADLGRPQLSLPLRAGPRQLLAVRLRLVQCLRAAGWSARPAIAPGRVPPGALVAVVSPFLDDPVAELAASLARRGCTVLAVDVLPADLVADPGEPWGAAALAVLRAERRVRLDALAARGVPMLAWGRGAEAAETSSSGSNAIAGTLRRLALRPAGARR